MYIDRKSTRLNSSHLVISYAVFCLKKKKKNKQKTIHGGYRVPWLQGRSSATAAHARPCVRCRCCRISRYFCFFVFFFFFFLMMRRPPISTLFPYTPLFRFTGTGVGSEGGRKVGFFSGAYQTGVGPAA